MKKTLVAILAGLIAQAQLTGCITNGGEASGGAGGRRWRKRRDDDVDRWQQRLDLHHLDHGHARRKHPQQHVDAIVFRLRELLAERGLFGPVVLTGDDLLGARSLVRAGAILFPLACTFVRPGAFVRTRAFVLACVPVVLARVDVQRSGPLVRAVVDLLFAFAFLFCTFVRNADAVVLFVSVVFFFALVLFVTLVLFVSVVFFFALMQLSVTLVLFTVALVLLVDELRGARSREATRASRRLREASGRRRDPDRAASARIALTEGVRRCFAS